jgi:hypothetical protein
MSRIVGGRRSGLSALRVPSRPNCGQSAALTSPNVSHGASHNVKNAVIRSVFFILFLEFTGFAMECAH